MHTDERHDSRDEPRKSGGKDGLRGRFGALAVRVLALLARTVGGRRAERREPSARSPGGVLTRIGRRDETGKAAEREDRSEQDVTAARADGRLRVSNDEGAYVESDTWMDVKR